jgi:hypothetical protein
LGELKVPSIILIFHTSNSSSNEGNILVWN